MRQHSFCYFHARVHRRTRDEEAPTLNFPVPEDFAAIQESIAKVFDAIINERIDFQDSSRILWGLQIATQTISRMPTPPTDSVESVTLSKKGDELAPPLEVCPPAPENPGGKPKPARSGIDPAAPSDKFQRLENARVENPGSLQ
ncbi:MAG TPA: hypothetical protein VGG45_09020 [Terracidiphilus sp.]